MTALAPIRSPRSSAAKERKRDNFHKIGSLMFITPLDYVRSKKRPKLADQIEEKISLTSQRGHASSKAYLKQQSSGNLA